MALKEELSQIRQQGMERAAAIWETLENIPEPVNPADVYKAACSIKCAEFLTRIKRHRMYMQLMQIVLEFLDTTLQIVPAEEGSEADGVRVINIFEKEMPLTDEVFNDPTAYATRQHVYDGIILLSSIKLGKEAETKACIERMQQDVAGLMVVTYLKEALLGNMPRGSEPEDPKKTDA